MLSTFESFKFESKIIEDEDDINLFPTAKPIKSMSINSPLSPPQYLPPSFRIASEYRELLLPRRIKDDNQPTCYRLARPGELIDEKGNPATLYDFIKTPSEALDEFGIGVSLYFRILRALVLIFLICGFISIVAMNENQKHQVTTKTGHFNSNNCLISSPIDSIPQTQNSTINQIYSNINIFTTDTITQYPNKSNINSTNHLVYTPLRILGSAYGSTVNDLMLSRQGASDITITGLLVIVTAIAGMAMKHQINKIDTSQQTTKDYSVVILNPPETADDPQEYFDFFSQFGEIVLITIVKTNGKIFRLFADKKRIDTTLVKVDQSLRMLFAETTRGWLIRLKISFFTWWKIYLHNSSNQIEQKLYDAAHEPSIPWQVFITFNKEFSRNACLEKMAVGKLDVWLNQKENQEDIVFKDRILRVKVAEEPTDIIYFNSDLTYYQQLRYSLTSYAICLLFLYLALFLVRYVYFQFKGIVGAAIITLINTSLPLLIKVISKTIEKHHTDGDLQSSILIKLVFTRCINGTIFVFWVNRHDIFSADALQAIQNILIAENIAILIRLSNLSDLAQRYLLTSFDITQTEMNTKWQGAEWTLAERYSDCLKNIFFTLFYCVPLPSLFFLASFTFMNTYFVDKYSLFRLWKRKPANGESLGKLSRHFLTFSVFFHILMSIFFFSNWPFKSLCTENTTNYNIVYFNFDYSYLQKENDDRYSIVYIYVVSLYTAILILIIYTLLHVFKKIGKIFTPQKFRCFNLFIDFDSKEYHPVEFRDIEGAAAYIPHYHPPDLLNPLFGCDLTELPVQFSPLTSNSFGDYIVDPRDYSIVKPEYFTYLNDEGLKKLFSSVLFFEDPFRLCEKLDDGLDEGNIITPEAYASSIYVMDFDLPHGWMCRQLLNGQLFYVDLNNETVTWRKPPKKCRFQRSLTIRPNKVDQLTTIANTIELLPPGWEIAYNSNNIPYFIDHNTKQTHWSIPEELLHPEPISDNDSKSETTASSILSYFSQRSFDDSSKFDVPILDRMKSIGKSMKNLFGKKPPSKKNLNQNETVKDALEDIELDDLNDIEENKSNLFTLQDSDEIKDNGGKLDKENLSSQQGISNPRSLLLRRRPHSSLSISTSLKSFGTDNNNNNNNDNNDNNDNNEQLTKSQESIDIDGDASIDEFPVLNLSELSPSHISQYKTPTNQYTLLNSNTIENNLDYNDIYDNDCNVEENIISSSCVKTSSPKTQTCNNSHSNQLSSTSLSISSSPTSLSLPTTTITTITTLPNSNTSCENKNCLNDNVKSPKVNSCRRVEQDVLAFVFGVDNNSFCSEDESKFCDTSQQLDEEKQFERIIDLDSKNQNTVNEDNQNTNVDNFKKIIRISPNNNKNDVKSSSSPLSQSSSGSTKELSSSSKTTPQQSSESLVTPKSSSTPKVSPSTNNQQTNDNKILPKGWEKCYTPKGKLFYINHNDKTTHWNLPNA